MDSRSADAAREQKPQDEAAGVRDEQIRLQTVMIDLLNSQLRDCRSRIDRQTEEIVELKRLIRVRDDLLYLQGAARPGNAREPARGVFARLVAWLPRPKRG